MAISFDLTSNSQRARDHYHEMATSQMRPISRKYDDLEHELPTEWVDYFWKSGRGGPSGIDPAGPGDGFVQVCVQAEELCWPPNIWITPESRYSVSIRTAPCESGLIERQRTAPRLLLDITTLSIKPTRD